MWEAAKDLVGRSTIASLRRGSKRPWRSHRSTGLDARSREAGSSMAHMPAAGANNTGPDGAAITRTCLKWVDIGTKKYLIYWVDMGTKKYLDFFDLPYI